MGKDAVVSRAIGDVDGYDERWIFLVSFHVIMAAALLGPRAGNSSPGGPR